MRRFLQSCGLLVMFTVAGCAIASGPHCFTVAGPLAHASCVQLNTLPSPQAGLPEPTYKTMADGAQFTPTGNAALDAVLNVIVPVITALAGAGVL